MKKALAILVAVMMMATICMTASAGSFAMKIADKEIEEGTATVDVPVQITANTGIFGFVAEISFDTSILTYKTVAAGELFTVTPNEKEPGVVKVVVESKDVTADVTATSGDVIVLSFDVKGAAGDVANLTATLPDADSNIDTNGDNVDTTIAAGSVSIVAAAEPSASETTPSVTEPSATEPSATEPSATEPSATEPSEAPATQPTAAPTTAPTAAPTTNAAVPSTGSMIPAAAVVLASASAAVLCFARKK